MIDILYLLVWAAVLLQSASSTALSESSNEETSLSLIEASFQGQNSHLSTDVLSGGNATDDDPDEPFCEDKQSSRYDPLACWLWKLKVAVPDQEFKKSLVTVVSIIDVWVVYVVLVMRH